MPLLAETVIIVSRYRAFMPFGRKIEVKKSKYEIDMCSGTDHGQTDLVFAVPLMLSGILQLMFNAVDIIVVGRFSAEARRWRLSGSTTALISMFTNLFIGVSLGTSVLAARFYAAGRDQEMSRRPFILQFMLAMIKRYAHGLCGSGVCQMGALEADGDAG